MDIPSYLLGKKAGGGGGGSATLIEKNITANNTYNASDDNADGYSKVVVNVPAPAPSLQDKSVTVTQNGSTTVSKDSGYDGMNSVAITTNVTPTLQDKSVTIDTNTTTTIQKDTGYDGLGTVTVTTNVPSGGGVPENNVMFYDYDGTVVYSYTKNEFLALEAMPAVPTHTGLTSAGWNWTLIELKAYVEDYGYGQAGATYIPTDGKTKIDIEINDEELDLYLGLGVNGTVTINWGDQSNTDSVTGSSIDTDIYTEHIYSNSGKYTITLELGQESQASINGYSSTGSYLFSNTSSYSNSVRRMHIVKGLIIGENIRIGYGGLGFPCMQYLILPQTENLADKNYVFYGARALKILIFPYDYTDSFSSAYSSTDGTNVVSMVYSPNNTDSARLQSNNVIKRFLPSNNVTTFLSSQCSSSKSLELAIIPKNVTSIGNSFCEQCINLTKLIIASTLATAIPRNFAAGCTSLTSIIIPSQITSFGASCFSNCTNLSKIDCSSLQAVPTLANTNCLTNIPADCKIIVPDELYNDWIATNIWSTYASHIISKTDWEAL